MKTDKSAKASPKKLGRPRRGDRHSGATTLKDIAATAGVSAQTVSRAINSTGSVSQKVRDRIRLIAGQMGYVVNKSAKAMRTGRSHIIGFVVTDMLSSFFPELVRAVERSAATAGYSVLLVDAQGSAGNANDTVEVLRSHPVDGVILMENLPVLDRFDLPVVVMTGPIRGRDTVTSNDVQGGGLLAQHLLRKGHRQIGMVTSQLSGCVPIRRNAFIASLDNAEMVCWEQYTTKDERITDEIVSRLKRRDVTALVCSHDVIAIRALRTLWELGINAPRQMSVVGFDDVPWASLATPSLTTIRQPFEAMGSETVRLLVERIKYPARRTRHVTLDVTLVERESVRALNRPDQSSDARGLRQLKQSIMGNERLQRADGSIT